MAPLLSPLDPLLAQIRVLEIDLNSPKLACRRRVVSLQENPFFAALSYVWGDPADLLAISIDEEDAHVTRNLYDALTWYRSWQPGVPIWADAVCINQHNVNEKNSQVQLMSRIYRQAIHVICWMGPSSPTIEMYLEHRSYLSNKLDKRGNLRQARRWSLTRISFIARVLLSRKYRKEQTLRILQAARGEIEFLQLPYLQRMWTFQEALLPGTTKLVCVLGGSIRKYHFRSPTFLSMPLFVKIVAAQIDPKNPAIDQVDAQILEKVWSLPVLNGIAFKRSTEVSRLVLAKCYKIKSRGAFLQLWALLMATSYRQCTDPRDKIFAVVGLLNPIEETSRKPKVIIKKQSFANNNSVSNFQPGLSLAQARQQYLAVDYHKRLEHVSLDALYYVYQYEQEGRYLLFADVLPSYKPTGPRPPTATEGAGGQSGNSPLCELEIPSWLPDMSAPRLFYAPLASIRTDNVTKKVNWTQSYYLGRQRQVLSFPAQYLGTVIMVQAFPPTLKGAARTITAILKRAAINPDQNGIAGAGFVNGIEDRRAAAALNAILGGPWAYRTGRVADTSHEQTVVDPRPSGEAVQPQDNGRCWEQADEAIEGEGEKIDVLQGLAFFVLDSGHFGVCPEAVRPGDRVVAATSLIACLVVRRAVDDAGESSAGAYHELVEYAYMDGLVRRQHLDDQYIQQIREMEEEEMRLI